MLTTFLFACQESELEITCEEDEIVSVIVNFDLENNTFYSYENWSWRPINEHEGQDTHCGIDEGRIVLKSCLLIYCTNSVRICGGSTCHAVDASSTIGAYCDRNGSTISFDLPDRNQFSVIIPIR